MSEAPPSLSTAQRAQLALLLEVSSTPKPGNVDRHREYPDLRFEHFVTGAVGALDGLELAAGGGGVGTAFERAVAGMSRQSGGNTQFGALLLVTPLVAAAGRGPLRPETARTVVAETTVEDAVGFYRAFEHVDVAVDERPPDSAAPDVRLGAEAEPALREAGQTLAAVMEASAAHDGIAAEYVGDFERTFEVGDAIVSGSGPVTDRAASVFVDLLAEEPDTFVQTQHGRDTALEVTQRAQAVRDGTEAAADLATELVDRGINPGTTADIVAGGLFVALERGLEV